MTNPDPVTDALHKHLVDLAHTRLELYRELRPILAKKGKWVRLMAADAIMLQCEYWIAQLSVKGKESEVGLQVMRVYDRIDEDDID